MIGPLGVNTKAVVDQINKKTAGMKGMKVPVKVIVDPVTKEYEISVGSPPISALIKKELGIEKGSGKAGEIRVGDISPDQIKNIAKIKFGDDSEAFVNQVKGSCRSMGVTVGEGTLSETEKQAAKESTIQEKTEEKPAAEEMKDEAKPEGETKEKPTETTKEPAKTK